MLPVPLYFTHVSKIYKELIPYYEQNTIRNAAESPTGRLAANPAGLCPVDTCLSFLRLCHSQSCGKCVPCRIGLGQLAQLLEDVLEGQASMATLSLIEKQPKPFI